MTAILAATDTAFIFSRLLLSLVLILVLGRLAALGCRRLGLPVVIGELLVGVALGPSLLGLVAPGLREQIFPAEVLPFLNVVSQLGIVLFMFLVGLELDLDMVKKSGRRAVTISLGSITLPFLLGVIVLGGWLHESHDCVPIRDSAVLAEVDADELCTPTDGQRVDDDTVVGYRAVDQTSFALFIGVSICGTAFAILARILAERNMFKIPLGLTLVACAAVDDIVAFTLLAVILSVVTGASLLGVLQTLGLLVGFTVALFVLVRPVLQRFVVTPYQQAGRLLPEHLAVILAGLFASAFFTDLIGVNTIIGAFLFGAAIPRPREATILSDVADRLDAFAVTLLLPVFFVITGQNVRINELRADDIVPAVAIILIASLGKFIGGAAAARFTGVPKRQALAVGTLMNTRGLAELVILQLGRSIGVLDDRMFTMLVLMAVATTTISPFLLRLVYPDRWLHRDIAEAERRRSSTTTERVTVVLPHDVAITTDPAVQHALDLAVAYGAARPSCAVTLLHLLPPERGLDGVLEGMDQLRVLQGRVEAAGPTCQVISRSVGDPDAAIVTEIGRLAPDIVITIDDTLTQHLTAVGSDVARVTAETPTTAAAGGVRVASKGGPSEAAAVEVAARIALHLDVPLSLDGAGSGRARRDLARIGVRTTGTDASATVATAPATDTVESGLIAVVTAGERDREPLGERLRTWQDVAPVVPLTSL